MKTYHNHGQEPYFTFLKNGQKTVEGRLQKGWYKVVEQGDRIKVFNKEETDSITTQVIGVRRYETIKEMLSKENLQKLLPDVDTIEEGLSVYRRFYNKEDENKLGAVAIEVKLI